MIKYGKSQMLEALKNLVRMHKEAINFIFQ